MTKRDTMRLRVIEATSRIWCLQTTAMRSEAKRRGDNAAYESLRTVGAYCANLAESTNKVLEDMNESRTHDNHK